MVDTTQTKNQIHLTLKQKYPDPKPALDFETPFQFLIAVILSAQTTDKQVNNVTPELFRSYGTPAKLAKAKQEEVEEIIRSIGFFRTKAKSIIKAAQALVEDRSRDQRSLPVANDRSRCRDQRSLLVERSRDRRSLLVERSRDRRSLPVERSRDRRSLPVEKLQTSGSGLQARNSSGIPQTMDELIRLPGVGRKTANVVLGQAFGLDSGIAVDTHVGRIARRLGLTKQKDPDKVEQDLMQLFPRKFWHEINLVWVLHGREICKARKPLCEECVLEDMCPKMGLRND